VHTVNGTAIAIPRIVLNLIETYYDPGLNIVRMPEALKPHLPFDRIEIPRKNIIQI